VEHDVTEPDLSGADLRGAELREASLSGADLREAQIYLASLSGSGANLVGARLLKTNVENANLNGCRIYGISAWDLRGLPRDQLDLIITPDQEPIVTIDNLEVAQFVYLMLNNEKIRNILTTIGRRGVLILGRFSPTRKAVLDALRDSLRRLDYIPMVFDFENAKDRTFTETIKVLAGLSRFIIADVTNPKSAPLELQATVPDYMIPFVPILEEGEPPFSMLRDLQRYEWVMPVKQYQSIDQLLEKLESKIIRPALKLHAELQLKKAQGIQIESLEDD
jgi:Pentapeptide repeats (8 copies)